MSRRGLVVLSWLGVLRPTRVGIRLSVVPLFSRPVPPSLPQTPYNGKSYLTNLTWCDSSLTEVV